jgi:Outer membrane lipoprotein-sorting protein
MRCTNWLSSVVPALASALLVCFTRAANSETHSAKDLAARLSAVRTTSSSYVRLRMEVQQPPGAPQATLQIQIKERWTKTTADVLYQVLWPKERKGEAVLLRQASGGPPTGSLLAASGKLRSLESSQLKEPLFGSDLSLADAIENFFAWRNQAIVGTEVLDDVSCPILESKPGEGDFSIYGRVRTWVDPGRLVPLRVEKYLSSGQLARRIETTRVVVAKGTGGHIPANLTVRGLRGNSVTELDGSRIRHDIAFTDREFTPEGLGEVVVPRSAPEQ